MLLKYKKYSIWQVQHLANSGLTNLKSLEAGLPVYTNNAELIYLSLLSLYLHK